MFHKIILVCTGNICRSPLAEALFRLRFADDGIQIYSAGTAALVNYPADPQARIVALEHGLDISEHRAQQATLPLLTTMDLILTLDRTHSDWIQTRFPQLLGRTYKLGRWRNNLDIADPYRRPQEAFEESFAAISECTEDWVKRIRLA